MIAATNDSLQGRGAVPRLPVREAIPASPRPIPSRGLEIPRIETPVLYRHGCGSAGRSSSPPRTGRGRSAPLVTSSAPPSTRRRRSAASSNIMISIMFMSWDRFDPSSSWSTALSDQVESESGSTYLFYRIFAPRTGLHFAGNCSRRASSLDLDRPAKTGSVVRGGHAGSPHFVTSARLDPRAVAIETDRALYIASINDACGSRSKLKFTCSR
jgi:hypothetical protein